MKAKRHEDASMIDCDLIKDAKYATKDVKDEDGSSSERFLEYIQSKGLPSNDSFIIRLRKMVLEKSDTSKEESNQPNETRNQSNDESNMYGESLVNITTRSTLRWSPIMWEQVQAAKWLAISFLFFLFVVDLADAIIDLILAVKEMIYVGLDSKGINPCILLYCPILLGRAAFGRYGQDLSMVEYKYNEEERHLGLAILKEQCVFLLEEGACILLLASCKDGLDPVEMIRVDLGLMFSVCFICAFTEYVFPSFAGQWADDWVGDAIFDGIPICSFVFQGFVLVTRVFM